jgi:hypothetical protein
MDRRAFLSIGLFSLPLAIPGLSNMQLKVKGVQFYKGYRLEWTGFKCSQSNCLLIGQWVAYTDKRHGKHYYASTTGTGSSFYPGDTFDIAALSGVPVITYSTDEKTKEEVKDMAYRNLLKLIDSGNNDATSR